VFDATPTVRALANAAGNPLGCLGFTSGLDTGYHVGVTVAFTYAALPDPFTAGSALSTAAIPRITINT